MATGPDSPTFKFIGAMPQYPVRLLDQRFEAKASMCVSVPERSHVNTAGAISPMV
jgi:hypothetical protein